MWIDDDVMRNCHEPLVTHVFKPQESMVVLGSSNRSSEEADEVNCIEDQIPILKRYGGGGTVLLYPGCVVVTIGCWVEDYYANNEYFKRLNASIIEALSVSWPLLSELAQRGISDIAMNEQKVVGTSLFRSRNYLLYQASIIVDLDIASIMRYLKHPSKEPDYRRGRNHKDFLIGIGGLVSASVEEVVAVLSKELPNALSRRLGDKLIQPVESQIPNLLQRIERQQPV